MIHLDLGDITRSYAKLIKNIKKEIKRRNEAEIEKGPKLERMESDVKGKMYTPLHDFFPCTTSLLGESSHPPISVE